MLRRLTTTAALVGFTAALTACGPNNPKPPPFTPSAPTSAPSTTPPTVSAPQKEAGDGAQAGYRAYLAAVTATQASGGTKDAQLSQVATGPILKSELEQATIFRKRKWRGTGQIVVIWTKPLKTGTVGQDGHIDEVTVQACFDSSKSITVDAAGKSVKKPGTPTRWLDEMQMRRDGDVWKAHFGVNKAAKC
ncbi:hypothetical protein GCM10029976_027520 [Kribbella albertanoniae]|uniref:Lipoprotein n=1 Tax=Kribbella albertanoniae TaxID=1266829 RepID=A0A4R4NYZ8_9ACTN|nr:hypothetical protein [Kribbella albertanoniae]TDC15151.1 hypothetical protein E1261_40850 [Kribbella albertanoniae]